MSVVVLDAWAVLAFLQREGPAAVVVRRLLRRAARGNVRLRMNVTADVTSVWCLKDHDIPSRMRLEGGALQVGPSWFVLERAPRTVLRTFLEICP